MTYSVGGCASISTVQPRRRSPITIASTGQPLTEACLTRGDTVRLDVRIRGQGLTGATLAFTAKSIIDSPDSQAEIAKATGAGITVDTENSTATMLLAQIVISPEDTESIDIPAEFMPTKLRLNYDLQMTLSGGDVQTVVGAAQNAHFFLVSDITTG
jgi:hypothetical protein